MPDTDFDEINSNREIEPPRLFCASCNGWRYDEEPGHGCHVCGDPLSAVSA